MNHVTKDGRKIPISELETEHLRNIVANIERLAKNGLTIREGGGSCAEDFWYDEDVVRGKKALEHLNYYEYKKELEKRI